MQNAQNVFESLQGHGNFCYLIKYLRRYSPSMRPVGVAERAAYINTLQ